MLEAVRLRAMGSLRWVQLEEATPGGCKPPGVRCFYVSARLGITSDFAHFTRRTRAGVSSTAISR